MSQNMTLSQFCNNTKSQNLHDHHLCTCMMRPQPEDAHTIWNFVHKSILALNLQNVFKVSVYSFLEKKTIHGCRWRCLSISHRDN